MIEGKNLQYLFQARRNKRDLEGNATFTCQIFAKVDLVQVEINNQKKGNSRKLTNHFKILFLILPTWLFYEMLKTSFYLDFIFYSYFFIISCKNKQLKKQSFINAYILHWGYKEVNMLVAV